MLGFVSSHEVVSVPSSIPAPIITKPITNPVGFENAVPTLAYVDGKWIDVYGVLEELRMQSGLKQSVLESIRDTMLGINLSFDDDDE